MLSRFSQEELDAAARHLVSIGAARGDDGDVHVLIGYLGVGLKYAVDRHSDDASLRELAAMYDVYRKRKGVPDTDVDQADPTGLSYSRTDTEPELAELPDDALGQSLGHRTPPVDTGSDLA